MQTNQVVLSWYIFKISDLKLLGFNLYIYNDNLCFKETVESVIGT
jgi:hypothetical protein